jgi:alkane 1-monooxygenase
MHFAVEHVRGHHPRVGTDDDPASARRGQSLYAFLPQSIARQFLSAWQLEAARLARAGAGPWTLRNEVLVGLLLQAAWLVGAALFFGAEVATVFAVVALLAVSLLEIVNYIEHYGLRRDRDANGRLEPVRAHHSWNSDHLISRGLLFELPRHTDHHMNVPDAAQRRGRPAAAGRLSGDGVARALAAAVVPRDGPAGRGAAGAHCVKEKPPKRKGPGLATGPLVRP